MADETTTTYADLLLEMKGVLQENFPKYSVLLDELRRDTNRKNFSGEWVRVPVLLSPSQGGGALSETGTLNATVAINSTQAHILMGRIAFPVSFSPDVMQASKNDITSFADAAKLRMQQAEVALGRMENEFLQGNGDALLASCTAGNNNSTTVTVGTSANFYQLYPGRIVDVLTRSSGTAVTSGAGRKIASTSPSAGTITLDTAVTTSTNEGVYIQGSYGNAIQGIQQVLGTSGTFQNISKTSVQGWQGVDGRNGDTSATDLSIALLDGAERRVKANGFSPDFYVGDPAVIDKYGQTLLTVSRWAGDKAQLDSGWEGISYRSKVLVPDFDHKAQAVSGLHKASLQMYGYNQGPEWDDLDGAIFKRISSRSLPVEAWLVDYVQLGAFRCNVHVFLNNLNAAA